MVIRKIFFIVLLVFLFLNPILATILTENVIAASETISVYVANRGDWTVSKINSDTNEVSSIIPVGTLPHIGGGWGGMAASPDGRYIASGNDTSISIIDTRNDSVSNLAIGGRNLAFSPDSQRIYVVDGDEVKVIDVASKSKIATISTHTGSTNGWGIAVSPDGSRVYFTDQTDTRNNPLANFFTIDTTSNTLINQLLITIPIPLGLSVRGVAVSPNGETSYVVGESTYGGRLWEINNVTNTVIREISVPESSSLYISLNSNGTKAYISGTTVLSVYNTVTKQVQTVSNLRFRGETTDYWGVAVTPDDSKVYTSRYITNKVEVFDSSTFQLISSIGVGQLPQGIAIQPRIPNSPPNVDGGGPYQVDEGGSVQVTATGSDPENGSLTYTWDLDNNGSFETQGQTVIFSAAGLDGPSSRIITVQVTDEGGLTATAQSVVSIVNVAPVVGAITAPTDPNQVNVSLTTSASFTDVGIPDTHTAVWDWGDSSTSAGTVTETNGSGSASGSHIYTIPGVYTVKLIVTDDDGASGESVFQFVVIYDPEGGFVTGGGWIDSPAGAYVTNTTLTGKANFGFVSKYQKGANLPTGQTEFQFKVASFTFHSTSYDWLVVAGPNAKYKGSGTINGNGDYAFMLTAVDGQIGGGGGVDRFRIKIWNKSTNEVIYDNQMGESDDANATDAIEAGSIVIHHP
ncbi:MAG: PKD domain-containing protein [Patescibacteria group bacterium]